MPAKFSFGKIQFDLSPGSDTARARPEPGFPFRLVILGDFSGRATRKVIEPLGTRRPIPVDCDNFEQSMKRLGVIVGLSAPDVPGASFEARFESVDDFHPDRLISRIAPLTALARTRERLRSPATASSAVDEARQILATPSPATVTATPSGADDESIQDTMARLLGGRPPSALPSDKPTASGIDLNALIKNIVVPGATPEQTAALAAVEVELAARLRSILHDSHFQATEALWRGLDLLVRAYGGEEDLKVFLLDVSKEEVTTEVRADENLLQSTLCQALGEPGCSVIVGAFTFDDTVEDIETLGRLANISAMHGAAFVSGASPHFIGCESVALSSDPSDWIRRMTADSCAAWAALRGLPEARHLGLVLPRVLLRQPYGKGSDPIDTFPFEELDVAAMHESFLWGNGAFVAGYLLADQFRAEGWEMTGSGPGELDDLPVFKFSEDGETKVKPCAEAWLSERTGERILESGLMPLLSVKGRGAVRLAGLQSVAQPPTALSFRWG